MLRIVLEPLELEVAENQSNNINQSDDNVDVLVVAEMSKCVDTYLYAYRLLPSDIERFNCVAIANESTNHFPRTILPALIFLI